jgi:hypothetical protein
MLTKYVLWSGGLDSTILLYDLATNPNQIVQPVHILIRNGSGKDAREREAITRIFSELQDTYPNVLEPIRFKNKISPSDHRNQDMIELIAEKYNLTEIYIGTHYTENTATEDSDWRFLTENTGIEVHDTTRMHPELRTKSDLFWFGVELLGLDILEKTWSCQLWFKKPCGRCFSCKERDELFKIVKSNEEVEE